MIRDGALFCRSWRNTLCGACICWVSGALIGLGLVAYNDPQNLAGDIAQTEVDPTRGHDRGLRGREATARLVF